MNASTVGERVERFFRPYPLRTFAAREIVLHAGTAPLEVLYVVAGRVRQYDIAPNGTEIVVNTFKPGAFFPMAAAINSTDNPYLFEAATAIEVRVAPAADVVQLLHDDPEVAFDLLSRVYHGVDGVLRRMVHLMGGDARTRLLFELINAAARFGEPDGSGGLAVPLKESELAKQSGLARETVSRLVQSFKAAGLVEVSRGGFRVPDIRRLEAALGDGV